MYDRAQIMTEVCEVLANAELLSEYCRLPGKPSTSAIYLWAAEDAAFAERFARARTVGLHLIAERMRTTAATRDATDPDDVQHRRLQIDTDKWLLARLGPKDYGDRVTTEATGGITLQVVTGVPRDTVVPALPSNSEAASQRVSLSYENPVVSETTPKPVVQSEESGQ